MSDFDTSDSASVLNVGSYPSAALMQLLMCDDIVPGSSPSYQVCKVIYTYHPLGLKMAEAPIKLAQSQKRMLSVAGAPEKELIERFEKVWRELGQTGADTLIRNTHALSRVYGISALSVQTDGVADSEPLPMERLHDLDLSFNVLDPLNTAGSLVLNQDPRSPAYLKPSHIAVSGKAYHPSRAAIVMNEQPVYIEWTNSAFGFVGRSVYQRALYPLKSFVQSMITDGMIVEKSGLLVMKMTQPGSFIDKISRAFYNYRRSLLQGAKTNNVISIGTDEAIESIDLKNIREPTEMARNNILKNIATAADMPASLINQETLAEGFGEGTEDAKNIARFIDGIRMEIDPLYKFVDAIVMRIAWSPDFYASIQRLYPDEYAATPYETAFYAWKNGFRAEWPNLLVEPDSEKVKTDDVITKAAIAAFQVLSPELDPENKARLAAWVADVFNQRDTFAVTPMDIDVEALMAYVPEVPEDEPHPVVESSHE